MRRFATGSIPGNYMWLKPGGRPLYKTMAGPARPAVGENSPFAGQDPTLAFGTLGGILTDLPAEYEAPPQPALAQAMPDVSVPEIGLW